MNLLVRETNLAVEDNCCIIAQLALDKDPLLSLYHNSAIEHSLGSRTLLFGMPEESVAFTSPEWLDTIIGFARENGYQKIIGPINGNTWNTYRFCADNFEKMFFTDISSEQDYNAHLHARGFNPRWQYVSGRQSTRNLHLPFITNRNFFENELVIQEIDPSELEKILPKMYPVVSEIFARNALFSPISEAHFVDKYMEMQPVLQNGDLFLVNHNNSIVGFGLTLNDLMNKESKGMITKTIGRIGDTKYAGVGAWISEIIYKKYLAGNYDYMVHAFMYVGNNSLKISKIYGGEIMKKYAVYEKNI